MKKSIFASIPLSVVGVLEVHLIYGITNLIISLLFWGISYIPIIKNIVGFLMNISDNTPDMFAVFIATIIAYFVFSETAERIMKKVETRKITCMITGILLAIANIVFIIVNIIYNSAFLGNALLAIAGIAIFCKGKNITVEKIGEEEHTLADVCEEEQKTKEEKTVEEEPKEQDKPKKTYIYDTAANGMEVRIPLDKYADWKEAQNRILRGEHPSYNTDELSKRLQEYMKENNEEI